MNRIGAVVVLGGLVFVAALGIARNQTSQHSRNVSPNGSSPADRQLANCLLGGKAFLTPSHASSYIRFAGGIPEPGASDFSTSRQSNSVLTHDWIGGKFVGYVVALAKQPGFLSQEQAAERQLHQAVSKTPDLPLFGPIVAEKPGVLEIYEEIAIFTSEQAARAMEQYQAGHPIPPDLTLAVPPSVPHGMAYELPTTKIGFYETSFYVDAVEGPIQMEVQVRGGQEVTAPEAFALTTSALAAANAACHATNQQGIYR